MENNCQIILKSIHNCRSYGPDTFRWMDGQMHAQTHAHTTICSYNNYVSFTASGLEKSIVAKEYYVQRPYAHNNGLDKDLFFNPLPHNAAF